MVFKIRFFNSLLQLQWAQIVIPCQLTCFYMFKTEFVQNLLPEKREISRSDIKVNISI